jgi:hypothetical protein
MIKNLKYYITVLMLLISLSIAQDHKLILSIQNNPTDTGYWWLEKNNFGIQPNGITMQTSFELKTLKSEYIVNIIGEKVSNKLYLNESFVKYNFSEKTFLRLGQYYRDFSTYLTDDISSGSILVSHNARAMPKIGLVSSRLIKKVSFDFGIAHGVFDKIDVYTKAPLLHEKFLYINWQKNDIHHFSIGFVHEVMWGGATSENQGSPLRKSSNLWKDFLKIFISADGPYEGGAHANALGNHLGVWDFSYQKEYNNQILKLYYQHIFEDTSGLRFANKTDGLWGIELTNYIPNSTILLEYVDTSNSRIDPPYQLDYYYSNYQYISGWTYRGNIIGNPFINDDGSEAGFNERKVVHIGAQGKIGLYDYQMKLSRKINANDFIKYKAIIGRPIKRNFSLNLFLINSKDTNSLGLDISYIF